MIFIKKYDIIYIESERKEMIDMTREKALAASRALDAIDGFNVFMEEVDRAVISSEELALLSPEFKIALQNLLDAELDRLNKVLEDM